MRGRVTADASSGFKAAPGRYHIYAGWFCPWAQRTLVTRALAGLESAVSVSYVDGARDGRGWAFRESYGPDPVNGFTLLREAYEATEPGFDGHVSVPALRDRDTEALVSNDFRTIGIDLATQFRAVAQPVVDTYPEPLRDEIEELDRWLGPTVNWGVHKAAGAGLEAAAARTALLGTFADLDLRLAGRRYLLGDTITEADIRLWVTLVRYDAGERPPRHQPRPGPVSAPVGLRPRPLPAAGVPRHHRRHHLHRTRRYRPGLGPPVPSRAAIGSAIRRPARPGRGPRCCCIARRRPRGRARGGSTR